jgi:hypothetical protein
LLAQRSQLLSESAKLLDTQPWQQTTDSLELREPRPKRAFEIQGYGQQWRQFRQVHVQSLRVRLEQILRETKAVLKQRS